MASNPSVSAVGAVSAHNDVCLSAMVQALAVVNSSGLEATGIAQSNVCPPLNNDGCRDTYHYDGSDQRRIPLSTPPC